MADPDQRLEERHPVSLLARVFTATSQLLGTICDLSRSGGRVQVNRPLEVGSEIRVRLQGEIERSAVVRRCRPLPMQQKFDVGFELMESNWPDELLSMSGEP